MLCPLMVVAWVVAFFLIPHKPPKKTVMEGVRQIDFWGAGTASIALILILIPVSGGGSYFEWNS